jgi:hypothetical protein
MLEREMRRALISQREAGKMALKLNITADEWKELDEGFRELYGEKDGKYALQVDGLEDATAGLKSALEKEREKSKGLEKQLKPLDGKTPEEIKAILEEHKKAQDESKTEAEQLKEAIAKAQAEIEATKKEMAESQKEATKLKLQHELSVPDALMKFIVGDTYEDMKTLGTELMSHVKTTNQQHIGTGIPPTVEELNSIAAQEKAGREKAQKINSARTPAQEERRAY